MVDDAPKQPSDAPSAPEPSMEEILASIRKIIADDDTAKTAGNDVLELTQMVQDDGSVVDLKASAAAETPPPPVAPPTSPAPAAAAPPPPAAAPAKTPETLMSEPSVSATATSLSSLASTVEIERLASTPPMTTTFIGNGARTLEEMALQLMKPVLKEWLDQNLPSIVDRLVQKEIERITKKN